jgi:DNA-directed RNA polymerase specialized sigma24 family protein
MDEMKSLLEEVKRLSRLIAAFGVDNKPQREQIRLLAAAGFPPKDIAPMIGTTANTVRVALSAIRKVGKPKPKRRKKQ